MGTDYLRHNFVLYIQNADIQITCLIMNIVQIYEAVKVYSVC